MIIIVVYRVKKMLFYVFTPTCSVILQHLHQTLSSSESVRAQPSFLSFFLAIRLAVIHYKFSFSFFSLLCCSLPFSLSFILSLPSVLPYFLLILFSFCQFVFCCHSLLFFFLSPFFLLFLSFRQTTFDMQVGPHTKPYILFESTEIW